MRKYSMFIFYYIVGIVNALALSAYPLIYASRGYSVEVISILVSISFIAIVFQPLVGYITDKFTTPLKMAKIIFIVYILSCLIMFVSFKLFIIGLILNTITRSSIIPLVDGYVTRNTEQFEFSYAKMRTALPLGFGTSFIVSLLFIKLFRLPISGILLLLAGLGLIALVIIFGIKDNNLKGNGFIENNNRVEKNDMLSIGMLFLFFILYAGSYQLSSTYLTTYYNEFEYSGLFMSVLNFLMIIPQIFLMFTYDKLLGWMKKSTVMMLAIILGIMQVIIYIIFPHNVIMLIVAIMFGGIQIVLFPASFYPELTRSIKTSQLSTGLTLLVTVQALWTGVYNQGFISRFYEVFGTTKVIYVILMITIVMSFIPMFIYRVKRKA